MSDLLHELRRGLPRENRRRNEYTRRAFEMLPRIESPRILDIGCGAGGPTMELARLSGGRVTGMDVREQCLVELREKIRREGLEGRVEALKCSMFEMTFPDASFDIVWSEGAIFVVGFERGLTEWRRLVAPGGYVVVHEAVWLRPDPPEEAVRYWSKSYPAIRTVPQNLEIIARCGYELIGHLPLQEDAWWLLYYGPLEARIEDLRHKYSHDRESLALLEEQKLEIEMYKKHKQWYGSAFFVMGLGGEG